MFFLPQRLPTLTTIAQGVARSRIAGATRSSCRITSADWISRSAFTVSNSGSPGPAPTRKTLPRLPRQVVSSLRGVSVVLDGILCLMGGLRASWRVEQVGESQICRWANSCSSSLRLLAPWMRRKNFAAKLAELRKPGPKIRRELLIDLAAQPLRKSRAFAGGRNRNLQDLRGSPPIQRRNRSWECRRRNCRECRARRLRGRRSALTSGERRLRQ